MKAQPPRNHRTAEPPGKPHGLRLCTAPRQPRCTTRSAWEGRSPLPDMKSPQPLQVAQARRQLHMSVDLRRCGRQPHVPVCLSLPSLPPYSMHVRHNTAQRRRPPAQLLSAPHFASLSSNIMPYASDLRPSSRAARLFLLTPAPRHGASLKMRSPIPYSCHTGADFSTACSYC